MAASMARGRRRPRPFEAAERGEGAVDALVAGVGVELEITAAREGAGKAPGVEVSEEAAVQRGR